jgi:hypothetical protein
MMHLYLSIIPTKDLRFVVYGVMALTISYWAGTLVPSLLICSPVVYMCVLFAGKLSLFGPIPESWDVFKEPDSGWVSCSWPLSRS